MFLNDFIFYSFYEHVTSLGSFVFCDSIESEDLRNFVSL